MDKDLADPDPSPGNIDLYDDYLGVTQLPVELLGLPPVMKAKHDRDGGGRQHLLVVVVVQTVSSCQGKSVANLVVGWVVIGFL